MDNALQAFFEEQMAFSLPDGTPIEGSVFIGATEFLPVETLREDNVAYRTEFEAWRHQWLSEQQDRCAQILKLHANAKRYTDLCAAASRGQVVPLVGSGMSVPTGLPTWSNLLRAIRAFTQVDLEALNRLIALSKFEEAADLLASATNFFLFNERIEHELRIDEPAMIDGAVRLLPGLFPDLVLTTNLDDVLEYCYSECGVKFNQVLAGPGIAGYRSIKSNSVRFLLKLHGDCRRVETRVLRTREYESAYAPGGIVREELTLLYRTHHILFLGCSLGQDRTVQLISEVAKEDKNMPKHFALLRLPASDSARVGKENFLSERGIYPIWYNEGHDEAIKALLVGLIDSRAASSGGGEGR